MSASPSPTQQKQYISFGVGPQLNMMIPTQQLKETLNLDLGNIVQIPDLPPAIVGVCSWRGELLWLIDLGYLLGFPPLLTLNYHQQKCTVLKISHQGESFGLVVSELKQLIRSPTEALQPQPLPQVKPEVAHLGDRAWASPQGQFFHLLNLDAMLQHLQMNES